MEYTDTASDENNKKGEVSIQIEDTGDKLARSIGKELKSIAPLSSERCIYKTPQLLCKVNEEIYIPRLISIGPYHRRTKSLQAMQEHKWRYLDTFLKWFPKKSLEDYVKALRGMDKSARQCYTETVDFKVEEFVEMLLLDSCFIIVFLLRNFSKDLRDSNDPIFDTMWMSDVIMLDMILLENQLPFFVLEGLLDEAGHEIDRDSYRKGQFNINGVIMSSIFMSFFVGRDTIPDIVPKHFLDFLLHFFMPASPNGMPQGNEQCELTRSATGHDIDREGQFNIIGRTGCILRNVFEKMDTVRYRVTKHFPHFFVPSSPNANGLPQGNEGCERTHSATELHQAGVKFKKSTSSHMLDVKFSRVNGVLEIPPLCIDDRTDTLFRNLIAWEQCQDLTNPYMISYAFLMDCLINTPNDVSLLIKYGIIQNWLGDNKEVSLLFNKICKDVMMGHSKLYFSSLCRDLNAYCKVRCHEWQASLRRDYFNSPWRIVSFGAALVLLILTLLQTIFTIPH